MCEEWMPFLKLPLSLEQFRQLPRNAAYKYEYIHGEAWLTPRTKHYHAIRDLSDVESDISVELGPIRQKDMPRLIDLFSDAFSFIQPFGSLEDEARRVAAKVSLEKTRTGGDGPWIKNASFIARQEGEIVGAIWITLLPAGDPEFWDSYYWSEPPPANCIAKRLGRPHLTWIFVSSRRAGHGVGTALLAASVRVLRDMGFRELLSTFLSANESSLLWHWRNGFRLLPYLGSWRQIRKRLERRPVAPDDNRG